MTGKILLLFLIASATDASNNWSQSQFVATQLHGSQCGYISVGFTENKIKKRQRNVKKPDILVSNSRTCRSLELVNGAGGSSIRFDCTQTIRPLSQLLSQPNSNHEFLQKGIRLNKVFKATHSRREADALIESGRVSVNGRQVDSKGGFKVVPFVDKVALDGTLIEGWEAMNGLEDNYGKIVEQDQSSVEQQQANSNFEYIKYWKPRGVTCTTDRTISSNIIDDLLRRRGYEPRHRVFPVGRLDKDTSGLILLTSDGRLPNGALRGKYKQPKTYHVLVNKAMDENDLLKLRDGVVITTVAQRDGNRAKPLTAKTLPCKVERLAGTRQRGVSMTLVEGRNRQIRKMMAALNYEVVELHRVEFMGIILEPLQKEGDWVELDPMELCLVQNVLDRAVATAETGL